jgi:tetratricopeptide (TPR) repeat protein
LHQLIGHVRESTASLEVLLDLLQKAGEQTHLTEIYELLAHAYTQSQEYEKARDYYLKLTQLEPHNQLHADNYQQVAGKLGTPSTTKSLITAEEGAVIVDELEAIAPFVEQRYSDEVALDGGPG